MRRFQYYDNCIYTNTSLTPGKVYDLIKYNSTNSNQNFDTIDIMNDCGLIARYYVFDNNTDMNIFKEVPTIKYRNDIIDEILN